MVRAWVWAVAALACVRAAQAQADSVVETIDGVLHVYSPDGVCLRTDATEACLAALATTADVAAALDDAKTYVDDQALLSQADAASLYQTLQQVQAVASTAAKAAVDTASPQIAADRTSSITAALQPYITAAEVNSQVSIINAAIATETAPFVPRSELTSMLAGAVSDLQSEADVSSMIAAAVAPVTSMLQGYNALTALVSKMDACARTAGIYNSETDECKNVLSGITPGSVEFVPADSCEDIREAVLGRGGTPANGWFYLTIANIVYESYCDFDSYPAWALVRSFSLSNEGTYDHLSLAQSRDVQTRNLADYTLKQDIMFPLLARSVAWRATCQLDTKYSRDFAVAAVANMNPLTWNSGGGCALMSSVNIRGSACSLCMCPWWQQRPNYHLHLDSSSTHCGNYGWASGAVGSEDNWGYYGGVSGTGNYNTNFRCTANGASTTNWWFQQCNNDAVTCDELKAAKPQLENGWFCLNANDVPFFAYCDFTASPAWTMVLSWSRDNEGAYDHLPLSSSGTRLRTPPHPSDHSIAAALMTKVMAKSSKFRFTCNMALNYQRDFVEIQLSRMNPLTFRGGFTCVQADRANIRGFGCTNCNVPWWQGNDYQLHIDSSGRHCGSEPWTSGAVGSEDNFGYYGGASGLGNYNPQFTCTASGTSTTNLWFS